MSLISNEESLKKNISSAKIKGKQNEDIIVKSVSLMAMKQTLINVSCVCRLRKMLDIPSSRKINGKTTSSSFFRALLCPWDSEMFGGIVRGLKLSLKCFNFSASSGFRSHVSRTVAAHSFCLTSSS